jgi:8-oxo-dGTP pyrophosphatase MutT (NUDIX family)
MHRNFKEGTMPDTANQVVSKVAWTPVRIRSVLFARSRNQSLFYCAGGKPEEGETDQVALVREVVEECGVSLVQSTIRHLHTFEGPCHGYPLGTKLRMACYEADWSGLLVASDEVEELVWFTTADLHRTTELGQDILRWFKQQNLID